MRAVRRSLLVVAAIAIPAAGCAVVAGNSSAAPSTVPKAAVEDSTPTYANLRVGGTLPAAKARCSGVHVRHGQSIQVAMWNSAPGATICVGRGVFRIAAPLNPRQGQKIIGLPGAVIDGSRAVGGWHREGNHWIGGPVGNQVYGPGQCAAGRGDLCRWTSDVFVNNHLQRRVSDASQVHSGTFFVNGNRMVLLGTNPGGKHVDISTTERAFSGGYGGNVIRNLVIQKFATPAQSGGAVGPGVQSGWTLDHLEVRWNHSAGIQAGTTSYIHDNYAHDNGQEGMCGHGAGVRVVHNELAHNNTDGYDPHWEAGGAKFVETHGLLFSGNYVHHNNGPGVWTDIYNVGPQIRGNIVSANRYEGVFQEIGYKGRIILNSITGNGTAMPHPGDNPYGAGILISSSSGIEVVGNIVKNNANGITLVQENRGSGPDGPLQLHDNNIHGNKITESRGHTGLFQYVNDTSYYTGRNNRFSNNNYFLKYPSDSFYWMNRGISAGTWRQAGNDTGGHVNAIG